MTHTTPINAIAWIVAASGCLAFIASSVAVVYFFATMGQRSAAELASVGLHDTYYIIRHSRHTIWPFLLCMSLSAAIMILGYMYTNLHMTRMMRHSMSSNAGASTGRQTTGL